MNPAETAATSTAKANPLYATAALLAFGEGEGVVEPPEVGDPEGLEPPPLPLCTAGGNDGDPAGAMEGAAEDPFARAEIFSFCPASQWPGTPQRK